MNESDWIYRNRILSKLISLREFKFGKKKKEMIAINKVYHCDNMELMKQIDSDFIDLIYCDILYGTGNKYKEYTDLKADRKVIEDFYIPRVKEMYRILKQAGSIYIHCDWRINHWIRIIMDEIFGFDNAINEIIWCYKGCARHNNFYQRNHDTILFYSKSENYVWNEPKTNVSERTKKDFQKYADKNGNITTEVWRNKYKSIWAQKRTGFNCFITDERDWWADIVNVSRDGCKEIKFGKYPTQKPEALLERIIRASSNGGDLVADFFCGSGTTLVVAKRLNRNFIGCDICERAIEITEKRLKNVMPNLV